MVKSDLSSYFSIDYIKSLSLLTSNADRALYGAERAAGNAVFGVLVKRENKVVVRLLNGYGDFCRLAHHRGGVYIFGQYGKITVQPGIAGKVAEQVKGGIFTHQIACEIAGNLRQILV